MQREGGRSAGLGDCHRLVGRSGDEMAARSKRSDSLLRPGGTFVTCVPRPDRARRRIWRSRLRQHPPAPGRLSRPACDVVASRQRRRRATLPAHIAYAAVVLVLDGVDGVLPPIDPTADEAAPLVGVANLRSSIPWPWWDTDAARPRIESAEPFALSPALDGLPLGYSAVLADAIPFMTTNILARLKDAGASEQELELASEWLDLDEHWGSTRSSTRRSKSPSRTTAMSTSAACRRRRSRRNCGPRRC